MIGGHLVANAADGVARFVETNTCFGRRFMPLFGSAILDLHVAFPAHTPGAMESVMLNTNV